MQTVVNGLLTNYEVVNPQANKTLLLLHGWAQNSSFWLPIAKLLSSDYRIILLDQPAFGGTKNLPDGSDVPDYTNFLYEFTKKLKLDKFILAGHSFGGQVAGDFALKYPKKVTKLILIDAAVVRVRGLKTLIKIYITKILKLFFFFVPPETINSILKLYARDYAKANEHQRSVLHKILKYNLGQKLKRLRVPAEIIWGSEDKVIPYVGKYLVENIPDAKLHIVYGAGHLLHLTHPDKLIAVINKILKNESA